MLLEDHVRRECSVIKKQLLADGALMPDHKFGNETCHWFPFTKQWTADSKELKKGYYGHPALFEEVERDPMFRKAFASLNETLTYLNDAKREKLSEFIKAYPKEGTQPEMDGEDEA